MLLNRFILLLLLLFVCVGEEPKKVCDLSNPFKKNDQTCGDFKNICVKKNDEDCTYFQKVCEQCPPDNYTVLMYIHILDMKRHMNRSNINLDGIKNEINISTAQLNSVTKNFNVSLNTIEKQNTRQVSIEAICLVLILLNFIFDIYVYLTGNEDARRLLNSNQQDAELLPLMITQNQQTEYFDMKNEFKEIKEMMNEKNERFEKITNEKNIYLESVVCHKLIFQIANQFDETELFVSKFDNVIKLKKSICDRNMNINDYKRMIMKYKGVTLDNNQYLLSSIDSTNIPIFCEFDNNFDVDAMIVIKLKCDNIYPEMLQIWKHQQIKDLKIIISKLNKTNHKDLLIFYKSTQLDDDDKTIDDYKIENNDWIKVVNKSEEKQKISMKSIFSEKETISIEFSKLEKVSSIIERSIQKIKQKMITDHFAVFIHNKALEKEKLIYEYNIDSKSLVEFCYFKSFEDKDITKKSDFGHINLYRPQYRSRPVLFKGYDKEYMENAHDKDLSKILIDDLQMFQITKSHPRFMQLFGIFMSKDRVYIEMENLTKKPMTNFLSNYETSIYEISKWANQILEGLKHLHNHNIILKDMNPMDIWIDGNLDIKLPSFNMTDYLNHLNDDQSDKYKHRDGVLKYVAPEILESGPYEASVDVWSLGVIMIEVVTRAQLFPGLNENQAVQEIIKNRTIKYDKRNKPKDLTDFIDCCVKGVPEHRKKIDELIEHEFIEKYFLCSNFV